LDDQHVSLPVNLPNEFNNPGGDSSLHQVPNTDDITIGSSGTDHGDNPDRFLRPD
jgi:hypothetical protein